MSEIIPYLTRVALRKPMLLVCLMLTFSLVGQSQLSEIEVEVNWPNWSSDNKVEVYDPSNNLILEICDPTDCQTTLVNSSYSTTVNIGCYPDQNNYYLIALDAYGDAWNGAGSFVEVRSGGVTVLNYDLTVGSTSGQQFFNVSGGGSCNTEDAFVENISSPTDGCGLTNAEQVTIQIRNQGSTAITTCPIEYRLNGGSYQSAGTFSGNIAAGGTANYNFNIDLSAQGAYTLDVRTQLAGDQNSGNDAFTGYTVTNSIAHDFVNDGDFSMGFEAGENTSGWAVQNVNNDGFTWNLADSDFPRTGSNSAGYTYSPLNAANDWMFTQCLNMVAGETYNLEYYYRVRSASFPEDFTVYICNAPNPGSVVSTIESFNNLTNTTYAQSTNAITVPSTGTYYIAWHITSPADQWSLYIDDIAIALEVPSDARISNIEGPADDCNLSTSETITVTVENVGTNSISNVPIEYRVDGGAYQSAGTFAGPLAPGATATFDFTADLSGTGTRTVDARTQLLGDGVPGNDEFTGFTVENLTVDFAEQGLTMGFETNEDFTGWSILNENGDGVEWFFTTNNPNSGSRCLRYNRNNSQAANDWVFSRCLYFEAGETYQADFFYRARNGNFQENLSLILTSDQTASSTVTTITSINNFNNTSYQESNNEFTVAVSGTYYLAWRVTSAAGQRGVHIDDISIQSSTATWIGNSTAWTDDNNWSGTTPTATQDVRIPSSPSGGNQPSITSAVTCRDLEIEMGANVSITNSGSLSITGNLDGVFDLTTGEVIFSGSTSQSIAGQSKFSNVTIDNPTSVVLTDPQSIRGTLDLVNGTLNTSGNGLTLVSDASGTARVAPVTSGTISGDVTVQRYINAGATNWRFLTAPVTGATFEDWDDDMITSGFTGSDFPNFPFVSIYGYDETIGGLGELGFDPVTNSNQPINLGEGYWVWSGDNGGGTNAFTIDVTGPIHIGNQNLNVSYTPSAGAINDGWTMVGNPYASPIDWDSPGWTKNNINDAIYIWDPDLGQYATYVGGVGTNGGSRYIASSQAFWVQANGSSPVLQITESAKTTENPVFFNQTQEEVQTLKLTVESSQGNKDETVLRFLKGGKFPFQKKMDARKRYTTTPQVPNIATHAAGDVYAINSLPELTYRMTIPVEVIVGVSGIYTIRLSELDDFGPTACVVLEDKLLEEFTDLKNNASYSCQINDTTASARFVLHVSRGLKQRVTDVTCFGDGNGRIRVTTDGVEGPWNYTWTDEAGIVMKEQLYHGTGSTLNNLEPGRYYVEVTSDGICPLMRDSFRITEPEEVIAGFEASTYIVDLATDPTVDFTNLSTGATTFNWHFGGVHVSTEQDPQHTFTVAGNFTVSLLARNENGCQKVESKQVNVFDSTPPLSVEETSTSNEQIRVFGAGDQFTVDFSFRSGKAVNISVIDMQGRVASQRALSGISTAQVPLNLSTVAAGAYVVTIETDDSEVFSQTISVQ